MQLFIMVITWTSLATMEMQLMCQKTNNKDFKSAVTKSLELDGHQSQFHRITSVIALCLFFFFERDPRYSASYQRPPAVEVPFPLYI